MDYLIDVKHFRALFKISLIMMFDIIKRLEKDHKKRLKLYEYYGDKFKCLTKDLIEQF